MPNVLQALDVVRLTVTSLRASYTVLITDPERLVGALDSKSLISLPRRAEFDAMCM